MLRKEDAVVDASFEARVRQEAKDEARAMHAEKIAAVKAELASFKLLE